MGARRVCGLIGFLVFLLQSFLYAQAPCPPDLRINSDLVLVPVSVADPSDRPVRGLTRQSFRVFDNGVEQTITQFGTDDAPITIGLVFDTSASMRYRLDQARMAVEAFFLTANPQDEFFLVDFADSPRLSVPLTRNVAQLESRVSAARPGGSTALLDAIYMALNELRRSHLARKALLIVSDGGDNASRYTRREINQLLRESDAMIYAIGVFSPYRRRPPLEEVDGPELLRTIAESSGGRLIPMSNSLELAYMAVKVGIEMRNRYLLGYSPTDIEENGRYHRVKVKLTAPKGLPPLRTSWRAGYYAPSQ